MCSIAQLLNSKVGQQLDRVRLYEERTSSETIYENLGPSLFVQMSGNKELEEQLESLNSIIQVEKALRDFLKVHRLFIIRNRNFLIKKLNPDFQSQFLACFLLIERNEKVKCRDTGIFSATCLEHRKKKQGEYKK